MTDRPDDLIREALERAHDSWGGSGLPVGPSISSAFQQAVWDRSVLADALEAAQKARADELRSLRETLERIKANAEAWHGPPPDNGHVRALAVIAKWADEVLAAKENTTP